MSKFQFFFKNATNANLYQKNLTLIETIDFNEPWWKVITQQRHSFLISLFGEIIIDIFRPLGVFLLGLALSAGRFDYMLYLFLFWLLIYGAEYVARLYNYGLQLRVVYSTHYHAHRWFLQVDPIYHAHRSSGMVLGKIDRAVQGYYDLFEAVFFELLQTVIGALTVVIYLCYYNVMLGATAFFLLSSIFVLNVILTKYIIIPYEKKLIQADDQAKAISLENLAQINLIRASFATTQANARLEEKDTKAMRKEGKLWFLFNIFYIIMNLAYLTSIFVLALYVFFAIKNGIIDKAIGISLLLSYLHGTYDLVNVERPLQSILKSVTRITDLFDYIKNFGRQTFPVLPTLAESCRINFSLRQEVVTVVAQSLFFDYSYDAKIFDDNHFELFVPTDQANKLYGIIGPSGGGKSTFLSLIGGQLKPTRGLVLINDINIYQIDDAARSQLIALQGQIASSVRGSLRSNLLFGLPQNPIPYGDDQLVDILVKVGLWDLFKAKGRLETFIGESGLTLSGGQRQRLNFANLYLRASFFKPGLILIDEPTSSLDEISEKAITAMIHSLARKAVTLVIAHRLRTIHDAVGIIDFSLLTTDKLIRCHTAQELLAKSQFYQKLMKGTETLNEVQPIIKVV